MLSKSINTVILVLLVTLAHGQQLNSPDKKLSLQFNLSAAGQPVYQLSMDQKIVLKPGTLGVKIKNFAPLTAGFKIIKTDTSSTTETWQPVWGEVKNIVNRYKQLSLQLAHTETGVLMNITFRLFNDGLGFRYEFPEQEKINHFILEDEVTTFHLTGNHKTFWIPGDYDTNEYPYSTTSLSNVNAIEVSARHPEISTRKTFSKLGVQTPLMMVSSDNMYINIHEAALVNYPAMQLEVDHQNFVLTSHLVPDVMGNKAYLQTPVTSPWRTIIVGRKGADILNSKLILNLNEPTAINDVSFIKPQKFMGIWWEMHIGKGTWFYADATNLQLDKTVWSKLKPNGTHSANTTNVKRYIDFASKHGITGLLIEGWNVGWEDWFGNWKENVFDFTTPYPDFDLQDVSQYAASKKVELIMHHETSGSATNYERRLDEAIALMNKYNYNAVKTGYVGKVIPRGEYHDGQWMVNHYNRVAQKLAAHKIMVDAHEPTRPTGLHRTYPNWMASEAARGNEFNGWSMGNPPEHETILPFTRLVGGPMDYTPGIFQIKRSYYDSSRTEQVHTTLAKQLALYVTLYSPLQMAADLPENYERYLDAFQFIKDVAVDWDDTQVLEAEPGDYVTIARKAKGSDVWFVGAITDENARVANIPCQYLDNKKDYVVTIYADGPQAHWEKNPQSYQINKFIINKTTVMKIKLAPGGGAALTIRPATKDEMRSVKRYR